MDLLADGRAVSVVGTEITDALTDKLEISLYISTALFAIALAATFAIWFAVERTLSIHSIVITRRTVLLGGDPVHLRARHAAGICHQRWPRLNVGVVVFMALIAGVCGLRSAPTKFSLLIAYILTRPLGASFGDMLSQSRDYGGLGFGTIYTSLAFLAVIVALVGWLSFEGDDGRNPETSPGA